MQLLRGCLVTAHVGIISNLIETFRWGYNLASIVCDQPEPLGRLFDSYVSCVCQFRCVINGNT